MNERARREAEARKYNCEARFHEAGTVQQIKEWIMEYHPELLVPAGDD